MSNCTKTGAHIFIEPYQEYAYGDAFEIQTVDSDAVIDLAYNDLLNKTSDVAYFRIVARSFKPLGPTLHYTVGNYDNWFDKDDQTGLPSTLITKNFIYHGYEGKPL